MGDGGISISLPMVLDLVKVIGPYGVFLLLGFLNMRWVDKRLSEERAVQASTLQQYQRDMAEQREMYKNNVLLVQETQRIGTAVTELAGELASIVHLNTQVQTKLVDRIDNNLFCPMVRAKGPTG